MTPVRIAIGQFMEESNTFVRQQADLDLSCPLSSPGPPAR